MSSNDLLERAKSLDAAEKVALVEALLDDLDHPDASIDAEWSVETERRLLAYRRGEIQSIPLEDALERFRTR